MRDGRIAFGIGREALRLSSQNEVVFRAWRHVFRRGGLRAGDGADRLAPGALNLVVGDEARC
jgi:hypothetical protein